MSKGDLMKRHCWCKPFISGRYELVGGLYLCDCGRKKFVSDREVMDTS